MRLTKDRGREVEAWPIGLHKHGEPGLYLREIEYLDGTRKLDLRFWYAKELKFGKGKGMRATPYGVMLGPIESNILKARLMEVNLNREEK